MRPDGGLSIVGLAVQSGPRFARDALGPLLVFYASWKLVGLAAGIAAAVVTVGVYVMTSRLGDRPQLGLTSRKRLGKRVE